MIIKPGDLYFTTGGEFTSEVIRFITHSKWSHIQIIVNSDPTLSVVSADANGIYCRDVEESEKPIHAILTYPEMTLKERQDVCKFCFSKIGSKYDFLGLADFLVNADIQVEDRFFCSELAFLAYQAAGINLLERIDHAFVSPELLYISPLLRVVEEI